jgi:alanine racemase
VIVPASAPSVQPAEAAPAAARLTIDLDAIVHNWRQLAARAAPAGCAAVVKANAYGLGLGPVVRALSRAGCRTFFVAQAGEAVGIRESLGADAHTTVYVFSGLDGRSLSDYERHGLRPVLSNMSEAEAWLSHSGAIGAALHVDTGMHRLGLSENEAQRIAVACAASSGRKRLDILLSHFVASEVADHPLNRQQIRAFERTRAGFVGIAASLANSSGIFLPSRPHYDLVRPGYALYGGNPTPGLPNPMRPAIQLHARILQIRTVPIGASVGYNAQWLAKRPSRLATLGVGYADGFPRSAGAAAGTEGARAIVAGTSCAIVGRVSMDLAVLDITDIPESSALAPGQFVELLGKTIGIDELALRSQRSGYEILTGLGARYERCYRGSV